MLSINTHIEGMDLSQFILKYKLNHIICDNVNSDEFVFNAITPTTLGISYSSPWIFKQRIIDKFEGRLINNHGMRLPHNRGGGGITWAILMKVRIGFCAYHFVTRKIDDGGIIYLKEFEYSNSCKTPKDYLSDDIKHNMIETQNLLNKILLNEPFSIINQPEYLSTNWPRLNTKIHGWIDWNWKCEEINTFINAFGDPYPGASTFFNNERVFINEASSEFYDGYFHPFQYGLVYRKIGANCFVAAKEGSLIIKKISDEQGLDITAKVKIGDRFYTDSEELTKSKSIRVQYDSKGNLILKRS
jgi:methionyl-tRNA formyltransferase